MMTQSPNDLSSKKPVDYSAEKIVLGSLLLSEEAIFDVIEILKPSYFSKPKNQIIFNAIVELHSNGNPVDSVTVADFLTEKNEIKKVGDVEYISDLTTDITNPAGADYYAKIVHDKAILRELVEAGQKITNLAFKQVGKTKEIIDESQKILYNATEKTIKSSVEQIGQNMGTVLSELNPSNKEYKDLGIKSGLTDLDRNINGFQPGRLIILAARPAIGKSSLVLNFARHATLNENKKVLMFSLEMSKEEILQRTFSAEANISLTNIQKREFISQKNWADLQKVGNKLKETQLFIDDGGNTINEISTKARRLKQSQGLDMIIVDYIGLISSSESVENRQLEISAFSRRFKLLANELEIPIILLAQLNRNIELRPGKAQRPQLSDLRESGSLEQDADIVLFLHRDEKKGDEDNDTQETNNFNYIFPTKLTIAKHRNGATGVVDLIFIGNKTRFENKAKVDEPIKN